MGHGRRWLLRTELLRIVGHGRWRTNVHAEVGVVIAVHHLLGGRRHGRRWHAHLVMRKVEHLLMVRRWRHEGRRWRRWRRRRRWQALWMHELAPRIGHLGGRLGRRRRRQWRLLLCIWRLVFCGRGCSSLMRGLIFATKNNKLVFYCWIIFKCPPKNYLFFPKKANYFLLKGGFFIYLELFYLLINFCNVF